MSWRVPFVDFPKQFHLQEGELMRTIHDVLVGGDLIMRHQLKVFEEHLADFVGVRHAVGVSNCTDGLRLLAHALRLGPGDEVVSVAHTFVATISPFRLAGCTPVLVDIGDDHNMDPRSVEGALSDRTKVVIPVHLNGRVCDMDAIAAHAERVGAIVIEDAAQALGATFRGRKSGSIGLASVFSFYPAKLLGALGDGGAVLTDDDGLANEIRMYRDHGRATKTELGGWGYNCRLDNLQAAVLDLRLRSLPTWIERRRELATIYDDAFKKVDQIRTLPGPDADADHYDVFQNYPVLVTRRDDLVVWLQDRGIETLVSWPVPLHRQRALELAAVSLPVTEHVSESVLSLPLFPELEDEQVRYVAQAVLDFLE